MKIFHPGIDHIFTAFSLEFLSCRQEEVEVEIKHHNQQYQPLGELDVESSVLPAHWWVL